MSLVSRAAASLVDGVSKTREISKLKPKASYHEHNDEGKSTAKVPPKPPTSSKSEEIEAVLTLEVPRFDPTRQFPGLTKLKIDRKDRHIKAVDDFSKLLDQIAEDLEQDVLKISVTMREGLEEIDASLAGWFTTLDDAAFLVCKSEDDLKDVLSRLKGIIRHRCEVIDNFESRLDGIETKRSDIVGAELKKLVDILIGIAHQLPDEIEHIVEAETFDLNSVATKNRHAHAELLCMLRKTHIEKEVETVQRWEDSRRKWRNIRHMKALSDFDAHIRSSEFTDPADRQELMRSVRRRQQERQDDRIMQLKKLADLRADTINQNTVSSVQHHLSSLSEEELNAIQSCYNNMTDLRTRLRLHAENRVESLRKELHLYGALEAEPDFANIAIFIQQALDDQSLSELWRLGGGLKPEFQLLVADLNCEEIVYNNFVVGIQQRFEMICCSFGLKAILQERGRLMQLERVRTLIAKMRSVARSEVAGVIRSLLPDLEEVVDAEMFPSTFRNVVSGCLTEMRAEVDRIEAVAATAAAAAPSTAGANSTAAGLKNSAIRVSSSRSVLRSSSRKTLASSRIGETYQADQCVDPLLVKSWNRRLGILYYGCDLPKDCQQACLDGVNAAMQKVKCNHVIDGVISSNCDEPLARLDRGYKRLIDSVANFLEAQENYQVNCCNRIGEFYLKLAKLIEAHRKEQSDLDEKSADELWDLSEDFRLEREDRETLLLQLCEALRQSVGHEQLQENFKNVLDLLEAIEESYRSYHSKACFAADKHPLRLIDEFKRYTVAMTNCFAMKPRRRHPLMVTYDFIYDETIRLNKRFFDADPAAGGVPPRETIDSNPHGGLSTDAIVEATKSAVAAATTSLSKASRPPSSKKASRPPSGGSDKKPVGSARKKERGKRGTASESLSSSVSSSFVVDDGLDYVSPNLTINESSEQSITSRDEPQQKSYAGRFQVLLTIQDLARNITAERSGSIGVDEEPLILDPALIANMHIAESPGLHQLNNNGKAIPSTTNGTTLSAVAPTTVKVASDNITTNGATVVHPRFPFLLADTKVFPITSEELMKMTADERYEYREEIAKNFVPLDHAALSRLQGAPGSAVGATSISMPPSAAQSRKSSGVDSEAMNAYRFVEEIAISFNAHKRQESDPVYLRSHPPICEATGEPWVLMVEIAKDFIEKMLMNIRDSLVASVEIEAYARIEKTNELTTERKTDLTTELEDRLRTHWPRRGRVETQIKQPREAELLGHEEKTWRHIKAIQQRMMDLQKRFMNELSAATKACDVYVKDVTSLRNSLSSVEFRSLAALQVYDVKARKATLDFRTQCSAVLVTLTRMATEDIVSIETFAVEFRKICPAQVPGVEGGYSEAELEEIEHLVKTQCEEMKDVAAEWKALIDVLKEQQIQSLKSQDEFSKKYDKVSQDLAMSEGLGQKYGAPRRRAQEQLRTAVTRDEQSAGKVDELLAKLEFFCKEAERREGLDVVEDVQQVSPTRTLPANAVTANTAEKIVSQRNEAVAAPESHIDEAQQHINDINLHWKLLIKVRTALQQRAEYLKIIEASLNYPEVPWPSIDRFQGKKGEEAVDAEPITSSIPGVDERRSSQQEDPDNEEADPDPALALFRTSAVSSLEQLFEEVEATCCKETRELYVSEGREASLGPAGIPDSLKSWLDEARLKMLGPNGYREKAWKRVWEQTGRLELIMARKQIEGDKDDEDAAVEPVTNATGQALVSNATLAVGKKEITKELASSTVSRTLRPRGGLPTIGAPSTTVSLPTLSIGAPAACLRLMADAMIFFAQSERQQREAKFAKLVKVWELGREKHERMLRPRLGSPDAANDLEQLDRIERERSLDFTQNVLKFRNVITRKLWEHARNFLEDLVTSYRGFMILLDSIMRREVLKVPPDTAVPKKRMTMKRMRKAQRLREEVSRGSDDRSHERVWPAIIMDNARTASASAEDVLRCDLQTFGALVASFTRSEDVSAVEAVAKSAASLVEPMAGGRTSVSIVAAKTDSTKNGKKEPVKKKRGSMGLGDGGVDSAGKETSSAAGNNVTSTQTPSGSNASFQRQSLKLVQISNDITLFPQKWLSDLQHASAVRAAVSSAHRTLIAERDDAAAIYIGALSEAMEEIREHYGRLLANESSWNERWERQVKMLKRGNF